MLAGGLTKSNIIGVVGAMPIPEVNRLVNAYIAGAQSVNPEVAVKVSFINSFDDLATAHEAALAQIGAGADVLYAERDGVIAAAKEKGVLAIGNMSDQQAQAPENVITSVVWDMAADRRLRARSGRRWDLHGPGPGRVQLVRQGWRHARAHQ